MVSRVQNIRSTNKNTRPPNTTRQPGEFYVNFADKQLGVIDPSQVPQDLIAIRFFSADTDYVTGDHVIQQGRAYRAKAAIPAGPFDPTEWETAGMADAPADNRLYGRYNNTWDIPEIGDVANLTAELALKAPLASPNLSGTPTAPTAAAATNSTQLATTAFVKSQNYAAIGGVELEARVAKAGDTMTGPLTLNAAPTVPLHAATKAYVNQKAPGASVGDIGPTSPVNGQMWWESDTGSLFVYYDDGNSQAWVQLNATVVDAYAKAETYTKAEADAKFAALAFGHGQCRFRFETPNVVLRPYGGNRLIIGGIVQTIPAAGVSLAATGLLANTTYYIYAAMSGTTMVLEPSTTSHSTHTDGVEIKTGDPSRTLVGMSRVLTAATWGVPSGPNVLHLSWFNRSRIGAIGLTSGAVPITSAAYVPINFATRLLMLNWAGEAIQVACSGTMSHGTAGVTPSAAIFIDDTTSLCSTAITAPAATYYMNVSQSAFSSPSEGYHFYDLKGSSASGTATFSFAKTGSTWG